MASIYSYHFFKGIAEAIEKLTGKQIPEEVTAFVFLVVLTIIIILFVLRPIIKSHKWRKKQLDDILKDYGEYTTRQQRWLYIKTWFQANPPHDLDDPSQAQYEDLRTDSIDFFINEALVANNQKPPYYCVLGGSGMGKSTFVVNLIWRYIHKYREKTLPYPIKLLYCGERIQGKDVLIERVKEIDNKRNTILVLDALDESNSAIDSFSEFYENLLENIVEFRFVIITCRTQFFEKHEDEPEMLPKRQPGSKGQQRFKKFYVSPLKEKEIRRYINKKYLLRFFAKKKARAIMKNCNQIMARPLLLSYIDDLLNSHIEDRPESIIRIYKIIIDKWLEREARFAASGNIDEYKKMLLEFSSEIALHLAQSTQYAQNHPNGNNSINTIIKRYKDQYVIKEKNLKGRSLLNRDTKNEYKFAHKSFMEYLVAKQLFDQKGIPLESIDCVSNDMIPVFLSYMISERIRNDFQRYGYSIFNILLSKRFRCSKIDEAYQPHRANTYRAHRPHGANDKKLARDINVYVSIYVDCDISMGIAKYISAFLGMTRIPIAKESSIIINRIVLDCQYDCSKIIEVFDTERNNKIHLINKRSISIDLLYYDFRGTWLVDFLNSLNESSPDLVVSFTKWNKRDIQSGNPVVIQALRELSKIYNKQRFQVYCEVYEDGEKDSYYMDFNTFYERHIMY